MQNKGNTGLLLFLFIAVIGAAVYFNQDLISFEPTGGAGDDTPPVTSPNTTNITQLTICSWNIQIFGVSKASDDTLLTRLSTTLKQCDIAIIQEIRDISQTAFPLLCDKMPDYSCTVSERKGRTSSKEQYGLIYRHATLNEVVESYNYTNWERPPTAFKMTSGDWNFTLVTLHSKPEDTPSELDLLDDYVEMNFQGETIVLGDFNQDGSYYSGDPLIFQGGWKWIIVDGCDTNVADGNKCYDRMYTTSYAYDNYLGYGIDRSITSDMSDHYLIWAKFSN